MGLFSEFFKKVFSKKQQRKEGFFKSASSCSSSSGSRKTNMTNSSEFSKPNDYVTTTSNPLNSTSFSAPQQQVSSKEGKNFKYNEEGRRYHGNEEVIYALPNDEDEQDRLHEQHWVLRYLLQRNYHAPVTKMLQQGIIVLDSGCGPGTWTLEMAEAFPQSKFYGIDITSVFPDSIMPSNVEFAAGNIAKTLPYPDNSFNYIHQRLLVVALTNEDWNNALKELFRVLKPGGYIELAELSFFDLTNVGPYMEKYLKGSLISFGARGIPKELGTELEDRLLRAGFINEVLQVTPLPLNHDGKGGELLWNDLKHACLNARPPIAKIYPEWEDVKLYEEFVEAMGEENRQYKTCINWYACYALKPLE